MTLQYSQLCQMSTANGSCTVAESNHPIRTACLNHRVSAAFTACSMAWHVCSAFKTHIETVTSSKSQEGTQQSCARTIASLATSPGLPLLRMTISNKLPNREWGRSMMLACAIGSLITEEMQIKSVHQQYKKGNRKTIGLFTCRW